MSHSRKESHLSVCNLPDLTEQQAACSNLCDAHLFLYLQLQLCSKWHEFQQRSWRKAQVLNSTADVVCTTCSRHDFPQCTLPPHPRVNIHTCTKEHQLSGCFRFFPLVG